MFDISLRNWLDAVKKEVLDPHNAPYTVKGDKPYTELFTEDLTKFVKIVALHGGQRSVWAFVAKEDFSNKALGSVRKGDILKAASWKAPAKTARGNIFDTSNGPTCGIVNWTGPSYIAKGHIYNFAGTNKAEAVEEVLKIEGKTNSPCSLTAEQQPNRL